MDTPTKPRVSGNQEPSDEGLLRVCLLLACGEVLEDHVPARYFVWPQDHDVWDPLAIGVAELLAEADGLKELLGIDAGLSQA